MKHIKPNFRNTTWVFGEDLQRAYFFLVTLKDKFGVDIYKRIKNIVLCF